MACEIGDRLVTRAAWLESFIVPRLKSRLYRTTAASVNRSHTLLCHSENNVMLVWYLVQPVKDLRRVIQCKACWKLHLSRYRK